MSSLPRAIADGLLVAGGLNWGVSALTDGKTNLVTQLTGNNEMATKAVYGAIGAAALYVLADDLLHGFPNGMRSERKSR